MPKRKKSVVILSGGAPDSALMASALAAIHERGKTFDVVFASGAGAVLGMLFLAPNGKTVSQALEATRAVAVDDAIYNAFPIGYKSFFKSGPFTKTFLETAAAFQVTNPAIPAAYRRFYNDMVDFWFAAATPSDVTLASAGLCRPIPFIADVVDLELLRSKKMEDRFFMNAYCIDEAKVVNFANGQITRDHFHAALAFPFVYGPAHIDGKSYYEGSSVDPINLHVLRKMIEAGDIERDSNFVLIDILGAFEGALVRNPRNLLDSFGISVITPICSLARHVRKAFKLEMPDITLHEMTFDVPPEKRPFMLDWSYSNIMTMWDIGYKTGQAFVDEFGDMLSDQSEVDSNSNVRRTALATPARRGDLER